MATSKKLRQVRYAVVGQGYFAQTGWEGYADLRVIDGLYQSMKTGRPVELPAFEKPVRPGIEQEIHVPPHEEPELVHAEQPTAES